MAEQPVSFDRETRRRFVSAIEVFLGSDVKWQARGLFALLIAFALAINGLNVVNSYVGRDFFTAISQRSQSGFFRQAALYIGVFAGSSLVLVFYQFTQDRLGLFWRVWMTRRITGQYLANRAYLHIKESGSVLNPDERIADDVHAFTGTTLSFTVMLVNGTLAVVSFSGVLWTISPALFGVAIGYACLGTLVTIFLGRPLLSLNYRQLDREATFRSTLIHVRTEAESIAISRERRQSDGAAHGTARRARGERPADDLGQSQPRVLHDGVQLPDPDHPGAGRGAPVHPRQGGIRRRHPVGDGVLAGGGCVLDHSSISFSPSPRSPRWSCG